MGFLKNIFSKIKQNLKKPKAQEEETNTPQLVDPSREETKSSLLETDVTKIMNTGDSLVVEIKSTKENPASLLLLSGPKDLIGMSWPLKNMVTSVGRSRRLNDIIIPHNSLSKTHFQIIKENEKFYLVDMKSTNKTYLNDKEITPYEKLALENNFYIQASHLTFKFLDQGNIESFSSKQMLSKIQTDPLTSAGNRQILKVKGPEYFLSTKSLSLVVFDIDDFKTINDSFGHSAGDHVLKTLSKYVIEIIREGDLFVRYGGDEFCIFTQNSLPIASHIAERIKQKIQTNDFIFKDQKIPVDISIGIAEKLPTDKIWEDIYHRADQQSYKQKRRKKLLTGQK